jgi:uncharacterized iron-regulated membrane protein
MSFMSRGLIHTVRRLARLLAGRNPLRRPYDRIEGAVLLVLAAAFLAAVAGASLVGTNLYQAQRAADAGLRPATAILIQGGPDSKLTSSGELLARWPAPGGRERSGVLTAVDTPAIINTAAGTRVPVWLNRHDQPSVPPSGQTILVTVAVLAAVMTAAGATLALLICYGLCRVALDRRRLAAWESAWASTGPRWSSYR